jgi:hypothetical protein
LVGAGLRTLAAGVAAFAGSFGLYLWLTNDAGSMVPASLAEFRAAFDASMAVLGSPARNIPKVHLANVDPGIDFATRWQTSPSATVSAASSFGERFAPDQSESSSLTPGALSAFGERLALDQSDEPSLLAPQAFGSFGERFALERIALDHGRFSLEALSYRGPVRSAPVEVRTAASRAAAPLPPTRSAVAAVAAIAPKRAPKGIQLASASDTPLALGYAPVGSPTTSRLASPLKGLAPEDSNPLADIDPSRTAIYDITSRTVYLPNGHRLEAHSGLGTYMDDPRSVNLRAIGVTPPNVYDLRMRESLFHGVRAIRLIPRDESKMYGRSGILAHSYMLGPSGQSNGCVSFSDYSAFLDAYQRGEITSLVVVERLASAPSPKTAGDWFSNTLKSIFQRS